MAALLLLCALAFGHAAASSHVEGDGKHAMAERHERWMAEYGRSYRDEAEKQRRLDIFEQNVEYIDSFNRVEGRRYKLGINQFTDLTNEEFNAAYHGHKSTASIIGAALQRASAVPQTSFLYSSNVDSTADQELPSGMDWRKEGAVTPVKNQRGCGSCWAFTAVGAIEAAVKIKTGQLVSLSEQELLDCTNTSFSDYGCQGGRMDTAFSYVVERGGLASESAYPYKAAEDSCRSGNIPPAEKIHSFGYVTPNDEQQLLKAVARQPIAVVFDGHDKSFQHYKSGVYTGPCISFFTVHALTIVGYGASDDGTKYWTAKNSYGESWGEGGYVRVQRDVQDPAGMCGIATWPLYPIA
ncbi:hypothetical protein Taro_037930 [Colocasia esculenta]|uniref:Uncharacterized protein n=1 Tax=Colocasia esculenta TaxID=4460 RepID=A0A843WM53_COLES|nr:hypothetical protein [Colocasia esculenta]